MHTDSTEACSVNIILLPTAKEHFVLATLPVKQPLNGGFFSVKQGWVKNNLTEYDLSAQINKSPPLISSTGKFDENSACSGFPPTVK